MQVIFIGAAYFYGKPDILTKGKIYDAEIVKSDIDYLENIELTYRILCDDNNHRHVARRYFIPLNEHRDKLIDDICN